MMLVVGYAVCSLAAVFQVWQAQEIALRRERLKLAERVLDSLELRDPLPQELQTGLEDLHPLVVLA